MLSSSRTVPTDQAGQNNRESDLIVSGISRQFARSLTLVRERPQVANASAIRYEIGSETAQVSKVELGRGRTAVGGFEW